MNHGIFVRKKNVMSGTLEGQSEDPYTNYTVTFFMCMYKMYCNDIIRTSQRFQNNAGEACGWHSKHPSTHSCNSSPLLTDPIPIESLYRISVERSIPWRFLHYSIQHKPSPKCQPLFAWTTFHANAILLNPLPTCTITHIPVCTTV